MKAMILAAGYGKRLAPITDTLPKPLIKVGNMSLIDRNINYLVSSGFHEIIINVSHHACLLYTSPSPRDGLLSRMPSSA